MRIETKIEKWGNSLALRVTGAMAELPRFKPGTRVTVEVNGDGLVVKRAESRIGKFRFPHDEAALLAEMTAENSHADMLADPVGPEISEMRGFLAGMDTQFEREPDREL